MLSLPSLSALVTPELFRDLLGRFVSGVTVVTTSDSDGRPHGMTVSSFCSLSLDPPLILVCIDRAASMFDLLVRERHPFSVNILAADQQHLSARFSQLEMELRFDGVGHHLGEHGAPVIAGAHGVLHCLVHGRHDGGDHGIFVGEVVGGTAGTEAPLVYHRGWYGRMEPL
ncbi:MAG: flavin reductase family protein [Gemmatimonadota bacterium]